METFYVRKIKDIQKNKRELEEKLKVELKIYGNRVTLSGETLDEYDASRIFEAIVFGFSVKKAIQLKNEDYIFKIVKIKGHTKRNLPDVQSRIIGKKGKTRRVLSEISNCEILIKEGEVGIIGESLDVESTETAIVSLIKGSKQTNMYHFLEKQNKRKKENTSFEDLPR